MTIILTVFAVASLMTLHGLIRVSHITMSRKITIKSWLKEAITMLAVFAFVIWQCTKSCLISKEAIIVQALKDLGATEEEIATILAEVAAEAAKEEKK